MRGVEKEWMGVWVVTVVGTAVGAVAGVGVGACASV